MGRARKRKRERDTGAREVSRRGRPAHAPEHVSEHASDPASDPASWATFAAAALIVAVGAAVYANSFSIPFLFDDYFVIVSNPETHSLEPFARFFTHSRGIPHLLDTLNYLCGGERVWGYHLVNVVIHLINALLVYAIASLTLRLPIHAGRYDKRASMLALLTALIFVAHPLQTMAVSYIVQRAESLAALFYLAAVWVFAAAMSGRIRLRGVPLAAVLGGIGLLGIMSKETVASLPAALLLYYACFLRGEKRRLSWGLAAVLALPTLYGVYLARHFLVPGLADPASGQSAWMFIPSAGLELDGITPWRYLITQFGVVLWYLRLFLAPTQQCFDYGWPFADAFATWQVLAPLAVLVGLVAIAVAAYSRHRWITFGLGWMFITLSPSSSIIPIVDAAFEYRMYMPIFGLALMVVVGSADALRWLAGGSASRTESYERRGVIVAALCIAALGWGTVARNRVLQDELSLARDSVAKAPDHWRNQYSLGSALLQSGKGSEAIGPLERAVELNPEHATARIQLGSLYARMGRLEEAEDVLLPATDTREESVSAAAYRQLGMIYKARGYPEAAIGMFEEALARKPKWYSVSLDIVRLQRHTGAWHDAAVRLNSLVQAQPSYATRLAGEIAETNLLGGVESFEDNEPEFARHMLSVAMENASTLPMAAQYLAYVEAETGNREQSIEILEDLSQRGLGGSLVGENLDRARAGRRLVRPTSTRDLR